MMKRRFLCMSLLTILAGITFIPLSTYAAIVDRSPITTYDSSKFEPIAMIKTLPIFKVMDQRPSKRVFFDIKRKIMPPAKYFRQGILDSIAQSSATIQDDGRKLKFTIKDFRVVFERKHRQMSGKLTSTMEVDVSITDNGKSINIGNYKTVYWNNVSCEISGIPSISTQDIQVVIDHNFHKILDKIFTDQSFLGVI